MIHIHVQDIGVGPGLVGGAYIHVHAHAHIVHVHVVVLLSLHVIIHSRTPLVEYVASLFSVCVILKAGKNLDNLTDCNSRYMHCIFIYRLSKPEVY